MSFISNQEKTFITKLLKDKTRLDDRKLEEGRKLKEGRIPEIYFGPEHGCCFLTLGKTQVHVQILAKRIAPKMNRPQEGTIYLYMDLSALPSQNIDLGKQPDQATELVRLLERCFKESRAIDLEALCIMDDKEAWEVRIDIHVLNNDGGMIDAASIAVQAALAHFRLPQVTVSGNGDIVVHSLEEKEPSPLTMLHYPLCVTYGIINDGTDYIIDPTDLEETVAESKIVVGANGHGEIVLLQTLGPSPVSQQNILTICQQADKRVIELNKLIKSALKEDEERRKAGKESSIYKMFTEPCFEEIFQKPSLD